MPVPAYDAHVSDADVTSTSRPLQNPRNTSRFLRLREFGLVAALVVVPAAVAIATIYSAYEALHIAQMNADWAKAGVSTSIPRYALYAYRTGAAVGGTMLATGVSWLALRNSRFAKWVAPKRDTTRPLIIFGLAAAAFAMPAMHVARDAFHVLQMNAEWALTGKNLFMTKGTLVAYGAMGVASTAIEATLAFQATRIAVKHFSQTGKSLMNKVRGFTSTRHPAIVRPTVPEPRPAGAGG